MSEYKLDKSAEDINTQLNLGSAIGFPSDKTIEYDPKVESGTIIVAPADGYMYWLNRLSSSGSIAMFVVREDDSAVYGQRIYGSSINGTVLLPVSKGVHVKLVHNGKVDSTTTDNQLRFIYAKGSEPKE